MSPGDADFFRLEVPADRPIVLRTVGSVDTVGTLFDLNGEVLASNDDANTGRNFEISGLIPAGVYFLEVRGYGHAESGPYALVVED